MLCIIPVTVQSPYVTYLRWRYSTPHSYQIALIQFYHISHTSPQSYHISSIQYTISSHIMAKTIFLSLKYHNIRSQIQSHDQTGMYDIKHHITITCVIFNRQLKHILKASTIISDKSHYHRCIVNMKCFRHFKQILITYGIQ